MKRFDLIVFDWDGTLIDSISSIVHCAQATFQELGLDRIDESSIRRAIGLGLEEILTEFYPRCDETDYQAIVAGYRKHWFSTFGQAHDVFPGVRELLEALGEEGYFLAVATAKSRAGLEGDLERTRLEGAFHATRTMDEAPSKPSPVMLESLPDELGLTPERALMVGDSSHDLAMAANAGMAAVGVLSGAQDSSQVEAALPEAILASEVELPAWLTRLESSATVPSKAG